MFDIGFWELILIGVVALVVLGPERLPVAIRTATHWYKLIRSTAHSVKSDLEQELKLQELHNELKKAEQLQLRNLNPELQNSIEKLKQAAQQVSHPDKQQVQDHSRQVETAPQLEQAPSVAAEVNKITKAAAAQPETPRVTS